MGVAGDPVQLYEHRSGVGLLGDGLAEHDQAAVVARELLSRVLGEARHLLLLGDRCMQLVDLAVQLAGLLALGREQHQEGTHRCKKGNCFALSHQKPFTAKNHTMTYYDMA